MTSVVVLSGGTATNDLVQIFGRVFSQTTYVLPISDNGGSTSEIIRVIGGPAIGDIRSRLTQLIPSSNESLRRLFSFRLNGDPEKARAEWNQIVEGTHILWKDIKVSTKEIIRSFLVHIHSELLKRSKLSRSSSNRSTQFRYELANVGNLFLTAVRLFIGSLDSAIELFIKIADIDRNIDVLPCVNTNFTYHIGALLESGAIITGQSQISHPSADTTHSSASDSEAHPAAKRNAILCTKRNDETIDLESSLSDEESGNVPFYTHPELKKSQLHFQKNTEIEPLHSPIKRVFYISPYGEEICPSAQSRVSSKLSSADTIVYSVGSLMTSIVPIVVLKGVGHAIVQGLTQKNRVLLLNGNEDRETFGMDALAYVNVIVESAVYSLIKSGQCATHSPGTIVTHLFYMEDSKIAVDLKKFAALGIQCVKIKRQSAKDDKFDLVDLQKAFQEISRTNVTQGGKFSHTTF